VFHGAQNQIKESLAMSRSLQTASLLLLTALAAAAPARADILYVSEQTPTIVAYNTAGGGPTTVASSGLAGPQGLAFDSSGNLYVANAGNGTIEKITPGGAMSVFATGLNTPEGLAIDASGNVYVNSVGGSNINNGTIEKITPGGKMSVFAAGVTVPLGLAFDSSGNLYVSQGGGADTISKITPGGVISVFANLSPGSGLVGLAFNSSGILYATDENLNQIDKITPGGVVSVFASTGLPSNPQGLAFDSSGNLFVAYAATAPGTDGGSIEEFTPGGVASLFGSTAGTRPSFLSFGPATTVPEPSTLILAGMGSLILLAGIWKQQATDAIVFLSRRLRRRIGAAAVPPG
jgi:sugar lactone lactonase YvrE